jgi:hypothetical protein
MLEKIRATSVDVIPPLCKQKLNEKAPKVKDRASSGTFRAIARVLQELNGNLVLS